MSRVLFRGLILFLALAGLLIAWLRHADTGMPFLPGKQAQVWILEARIDFVADGPVMLSLNIPEQPPGFRIISEQTASPGYGFSIVEEDGRRRGEWTISEASGPQTLYYNVHMVADRDAVGGEEVPLIRRAPAVLWKEPELTAARQLLAAARARASTPESLAREIIRELTSTDPSQNAALLLASHQRTDLIERLLHDTGIPARISMGLLLKDARRNQSLTPIIEIFTGKRWVAFDPATGRQGMPDNMLLWNRGDQFLTDLVGGYDTQVSFSMIRRAMPMVNLSSAAHEGGRFRLLSIHTLPIEQQSVFKLLLLVPIAALVTVFMRVLVGLHTSGTFMPILIALAFLQTTLLPGLTTFIAIVAIGLLLRSYLSRLNLLLVARIATIIVIVVFLMGALSLIGYQLGFNTGMTVAFFPIIIIAWTIERMSILWEEEGPREVLIQGGGSLAVAVLAFVLIDNSLVGHLSFNFPELNLVVIAIIMAIGKYTGYRLLELRRFRAMEERSP
ncbi:MAG: inactive transglutaminase family protein [Gammaproteobacteria bacterium]|nr:inactive transglutaminase family protein [Gammaproteobacteria bacterium]